jgi:sterol desaturase/sphingolipid hydroxylase (fatty acid hydroxylase superfamily)
MHRIHHSARQSETDSNYGVLFSVWDRMFNSYCESPENGYRGMTLGLEKFREKETQFFHRMLLNPIDWLHDTCPHHAARSFETGDRPRFSGFR